MTVAALLAAQVAAGAAPSPAASGAWSTSGLGAFVGATGLGVMANGDVLVATRYEDRVLRFTADGQYLSQLAHPCPLRIATDSTGFYVSSMRVGVPSPGGGVCDGSITKYLPDGSFAWKVTPPSFTGGMEIGLASDGTTVTAVLNGPAEGVTDVSRYSAADGSPRGGWHYSFSCVGIAMIPGAIILPDSSHQRLVSVHPFTGAVLGTFATTGPYYSQSGNLASDIDGNVYYDVSVGTNVYLSSGETKTLLPHLANQSSYEQMAVSPVSGRFYALGQDGATVVYHDMWNEPTVSLTATGTTSGRVLVDDSVTFAASATVALGTIDHYDWDVDGDGAFEATSTTGTTSTSWSTTGPRTISVRAVTTHGKSNTASVAIEVFPRPPTPLTGLSINGGAPFTNDKNVSLDVSWPAFASQIHVSNDGGFGTSQSFPLATEIPWTLDDSVTGRNTKIVYIRFSGPGVDDTKTYTDDIILDTTPPDLTSASANPAPADRSTLLAQPTTAVAKARKRAFTIRTRARDRLTGVSHLQASTQRRPARAARVTYAPLRTVVLRLPDKRLPDHLFVRVRDGAGNWTPWKRTPVRNAR